MVSPAEQAQRWPAAAERAAAIPDSAGGFSVKSQLLIVDAPEHTFTFVGVQNARTPKARAYFPYQGRLAAILPDGSPLKVNTVDLSLGGVGVFSRRFVEVGASVRLTLPLRNARGAMVREHIRGMVVHARVESDGSFLGVDFSGLLTQAEYPAIWRALQDGLNRITRVEG